LLLLLLLLLFVICYFFRFFDLLQLLVETAGYIPKEDIQNFLGGTLMPWKAADAQVVVAALDADQNGVVERDEFVDWVVRGLEKCKEDEQVKLMVENSDMGRKMASFILAMRAFVGDEN
jgi:hypothetical protein